MKKLCVVGNPVEHSLSPHIHRAFALEKGMKIAYHKKCLAKNGFVSGIHDLIESGFEGFSVTVPFKEEAFHLADDLSKFAKEAAAVNTLYLKNGKLMGDNTDGRGLVQDLLNNGITLADTNVLILGAGGATKGIIGPLKACGARISVMNRTHHKAQQISQQFGVKAVECKVDEVDNGILINATSAALSAHSGPWESLSITPDVVCVDLMYDTNTDTPFIQYMELHGAKACFDGYGMLVEQARLQFELFTSEMTQGC